MFFKIGHRGAPGSPRRAENTIYSFKKAVAAGANAVEFDVRRCASGEIMVIHDATVDRTTNGRGKVSEKTYEELARLDAGLGERIPKFEEVLDLFGSKLFLDIELKEGGLTADVKKMIVERKLKNVIVSAFDKDDREESSSSSWDDLALVRPVAEIGIIVSAKKMGALGSKILIDFAKKYDASAIFPNYRTTGGEFVDLAHSAGMKVNVWTVNEAEDIKRLKEIGIDGIVSDFPERL